MGNFLGWKALGGETSGGESTSHRKFHITSYRVLDLWASIRGVLGTQKFETGPVLSVAWLCEICRWRSSVPLQNIILFIFFSNFKFQVLKETNTKSIISQKLRIAQKKVIRIKNDRQINSNLPCKFSHFWRKLNFRAPITPLLDSHMSGTRYDVFNFQHVFSFSKLRIFYVKIATSEGGEGEDLHIVSWETT